MRSKQVIGVIIVFLSVILIGGVTYQQVEGWSFLDAVYFSTMTVTTVGYGDLAPQTPIGKIFTIFFSFSGIAMAFYVLTNVGKYIFQKRTTEKKKKQQKREKEKIRQEVKKVAKKIEKEVKKEVGKVRKKIRNKKV